MKRNSSFTILWLALQLAFLSACGGKKTLMSGARPHQGTSRQTVEGVLAEARCFHSTGANGADHQFCAFVSARSNLPIGIQTDEGRFVYLAVVPRQLAELVNQRLRVRGPANWGGTVVLPHRMWRRENGSWHEIALDEDDG